MSETSFVVRGHGMGFEDEERTMFTVGVAEQPDGGGRQLMITASEDDLEDADFDMDSYCVVDDEHRCTYGGVRGASLSGGVLVLEFTEKAVAELELAEPVLAIQLDLAPDVVAELAGGYRRVFAFGRESFRPVLGGDLA
ncbi:Imm10 family immunity protein [Lentzea sp. NEAU-D7]|uniref:Imm10 family immunity protein n=1 Tax=Lentzea sp. NEAU-D7 TaxID=2994667 RepID=UPI00224B21A6|nr:Imm10 family immunity protein [Lentzea sp. NEAU-D7]MCX2953589.1 Imm10 family immunity protein [Lentzea sp. NEAU-D7]